MCVLAGKIRANVATGRTVASPTMIIIPQMEVLEQVQAVVVAQNRVIPFKTGIVLMAAIVDFPMELLTNSPL